MKKMYFVLIFVIVCAFLFIACEDDVINSFKATISEINGNFVIVSPLEGEEILRSSDKITFSKANLEEIGSSVGDIVNVKYNGSIKETYPAQVNAISWSIYIKSE
jgi:hypothetical protein